MHHRTLVGMVMYVICLLGLAGPAGAVVRYTVTDMGTLGGGSSPEKINELGQVAGFGYSGNDARGFLWGGGAVTWIGTINGAASRAEGLNNHGQVVGWEYTGTVLGNPRALLWENGVLQDLNTTGGPMLTRAWDINDAGQVAVAGTASGYIWQNGVLTDLGFHDPRAINSIGQVTGGKQTGQSINGLPVERPVLWDQGVTTDLGTFGGPGGLALDLNDRGEVVGYANGTSKYGSGDYISRAFLYQNGQMLDLLGPNGSPSYASGINNSGQVVGQFSDDAFTPAHAFLYEAGTATDLNDLISDTSGWVLNSARAINDCGQIVGIGSLGGKHLFLLNPVPEPASLLLVLLGGFVCQRFRRGN